MDPVLLAPARMNFYGTTSQRKYKPTPYDAMFWRLAFAILSCLIVMAILVIVLGAEKNHDNRCSRDNLKLMSSPPGHNLQGRIWDQCEYDAELCPDEHLIRFCNLLPPHTTKVVRETLQQVVGVLEDSESDKKVILLIRDPRGVIQSRNQFAWYQGSIDCWDLTKLCADMVKNYKIASGILKQHTKGLLVIRYEDLVLEPSRTRRQIIKFLEQKTTKPTPNLMSLMKENIGRIEDTFRITQKDTFKWQYLLDFNKVEEIQTVCKEAMILWGYKMEDSEAQLKNKTFNPILKYDIKEAIYI